MDDSGKQRTEVANRIKRARGQLDGVLTMIEEGRSCSDIVTQLSAASSAIDRAAFRLLAISLQQCYVEGQIPDTETAKNLEKLLMSLA